MSQSIEEKDVRHVARLSRLALSDEQVARHARELTRILDYIAQLNELDVTDVEPLAHPLELTNVLREDVEQPGLPVQTVLMNAPEHDERFFKVPKVLGDGGGA